MVGFLLNLAGIILRGQGFRGVYMVHVAPMGAQGEGPQGPKLCKFQTSSPDPVKVELTVQLCSVYRPS